MNVTIHSASLSGIEAVPVRIHAEPSSDLTISGVASHQARESRVRVLASFAHLGFRPGAKVTIEGHPGGAIAHLDLAIAAAVFAAHGEFLSTAVILGELDFSGRVQMIRGASVLARGAFAIVPIGNAAEAAQVTHEGFSVATLAELREDGAERIRERSLSVAYRPAGVRGIVLVGPPGCGATLIARQIRDAMPFERSREVDAIYSVSGLMCEEGYVTEVPFRAPHHSVSEAGLVGGGSPPRPGEVSLAHRGVLYLDSIQEFRLVALDALFRALKVGEAQLGRGVDNPLVRFPARPALVIGSGPDHASTHSVCARYGLEVVPVEGGAKIRAAIARAANRLVGG